MQADVARSTFSVNGAGIKVGVLSDSFNCLGGGASGVANGDLSPVTIVQEYSGCPSDATDEGRAMLEIVHDVAPGSSLAFASAFNGMASFANNIIALKNNGAKVVVDDVFYLNEPMFQDGIVAQAVDNVVAAGVSYFSAAGNEARQSYEATFKSGSTFASGAIAGLGGLHFDGGVAHNFASSGTDHFQSITIAPHAQVTFSFQWDSPSASVGPGVPGSPNDLDIYLLNSAANQVIAASKDGNAGNDAVEVLQFTNSSSSPLNANIMIVKFSGLNPGLIKYVYFGSMTINQFATQSSTLFGHANAAGAEAVGAAWYKETPEFGISPPLLEPYSSSGGTPILFDKSGNPTNDPRAQKPEIVAPDGANTTFFYPGDDVESDGHPNFFGTSAAAPHAAGVAALLLDADPTLTPGDVYGLLEGTAIDMGVAGFDNNSGFGLIQADAALGGIASQSDISVGGSDFPDPVRIGNNLTYTLTVTNLKSTGVTGVVLTDTLPGSVSLVSALATQGSCNGSSPVVCDLGNLGVHAGVTVTIVVVPTALGLVSNSVTVAANESETNLANNTASQNTNVIPLPLVIGTASLPQGEVGLAYSADLQLSGGVAPYVVSVGPGSLPAGLGVSSAGIISGVPTKANYWKKIPTFVVTVTDSLGVVLTKKFSIKIYGALTISTKSLKTGTAGKSYKAVLKAASGKAPYIWTLVSGSLPTGLSPNGATISGVPTPLAPETFNPVFQVTDALGETFQKSFTLTVN
jgi:uncharacterized repeat protein (TIGR01451 family)